MENSVLPVMVSHGEGRAAFIDEIASSVIAKYVDPKHQTAKSYPFNPNGSKDGIAGVCNNDRWAHFGDDASSREDIFNQTIFLGTKGMGERVTLV